MHKSLVAAAVTCALAIGTAAREARAQEGRDAIQPMTLTASSTLKPKKDRYAPWRAVDLDSNVPFARAVATGQSVWALTDEELSAFTDAPEPGAKGWIAVPLTTREGIRGAAADHVRVGGTARHLAYEGVRSASAECQALSIYSAMHSFRS